MNVNASTEPSRLVVQKEVRPEHAHDCEQVLVGARSGRQATERDAFADDVRIGIERARPETVTEDHDRRLAGRVLLGEEKAAIERPRPQ
jgi:hypothetical protein